MVVATPPVVATTPSEVATGLARVASRLGCATGEPVVVSERGDRLIVRFGDVVLKVHPPGTDDAALAARLTLAGSPPLAGTLLAPLPLPGAELVGVATRVAGRWVSAWPAGNALGPQDVDGAPWEHAAVLLAHLHATPADAVARNHPDDPRATDDRNRAAEATAHAATPLAHGARGTGGTRGTRAAGIAQDQARGGLPPADPRRRLRRVIAHLTHLTDRTHGPDAADRTHQIDGSEQSHRADQSHRTNRSERTAWARRGAALADDVLRAYRSLPDGDARTTVRPDRPRTVIHGDWHLGQLVRLGTGGWRLIDIDDLGVGDPAWDLARPAAWFAAGLLDPDVWARFVEAYRTAGGPALPATGDPWPALDLPARSLAVEYAARAVADALTGDVPSAPPPAGDPADDPDFGRALPAGVRPAAGGMTRQRQATADHADYAETNDAGPAPDDGPLDPVALAFLDCCRRMAPAPSPPAPSAPAPGVRHQPRNSGAPHAP